MADFFAVVDETILWILRIVVGGAMVGALFALGYALIWGGPIHPDDTNKPVYRQRVMVGHWRPRYAVRWGMLLGVLVTVGPAFAYIIYALFAGA